MIETLVNRVRALLLTPKTELPRTIAEPGDVRSLLPYVVPLVALGAIARFISQGLIGVWVMRPAVFGMNMGSGMMRWPIGAALAGLVMHVAIGVGGWWFLAWLLETLAPSFNARKDGDGARKAAAFMLTPAWLAGGLALLQSLPLVGALAGLAGLAGVIYGVVIGLYALPLLMGTPEDKALVHTLAAIGLAVVAVIAAYMILFTLVLGALVGGLAATTMRF